MRGLCVLWANPNGMEDRNTYPLNCQAFVFGFSVSFCLMIRNNNATCYATYISLIIFIHLFILPEKYPFNLWLARRDILYLFAQKRSFHGNSMAIPGSLPPVYIRLDIELPFEVSIFGARTPPGSLGGWQTPKISGWLGKKRIPSGKHTKKYGRSQFYSLGDYGKPIISMAIFIRYVNLPEDK